MTNTINNTRTLTTGDINTYSMNIMLDITDALVKDMEENAKKDIYCLNITTDKQLFAELPKIMDKKNISISKVFIYKKRKALRADHSAIRVGKSRINEQSKIEPEITLKVASGKNSKTTLTNKYTHDFLMVEIDNSCKKEAYSIFTNEIIKVISDDGTVLFFSKLTKDSLGYVEYTSLTTGEHCKYLPKGTVNIYKGVSWTASNKRNLAILFMDITNGDHRYELYNKVTLGALDEIKNDLGVKIMNAKTEEDLAELDKKLQKKAGYIGNVNTESTNLGQVKGFVRYNGKFLNKTSEVYLTKKHEACAKEYRKAIRSKASQNILDACKKALEDVESTQEKLEAQTQDGQIYINARELQLMIYNSHKIWISIDVLLGKMNQVRPGTVKASGLNLDTPEFLAMCDGATELAELNGVTLDVVGDTKHLLFLADENAIKLAFNAIEDLTMEVLAFAKCSIGKGSNQLFTSVLYASQEQGKNGRQLVSDLLGETINNKLVNLIETKDSVLMTPEEVNKAVDSGFIDDMILNLCPSFKNVSRGFFEGIWRDGANSVTNILSKSSTELTSHNRRLSSDATFILTGGRIEGILKTGEVFINDKKVTDTIMIKYPKIGFKEFYASNNISIKTINKRAKALVEEGIIEDKHATRLTRLYKSLSGTIAVLPPRSIIANACAGLDFDYDGALFIERTMKPKTKVEELTNEIVDVLSSVKMQAVIIEHE